MGCVLASDGGKIFIGRDVRVHSCEIEKLLCSGLLNGKTEIYVTGVIPTPALAYIAERENADYAVMITASHNAPEYNGLKIFAKGGRKLTAAEESRIDALLDELSLTECICRDCNALNLDEAAADNLCGSCPETDNNARAAFIRNGKSRTGPFSPCTEIKIYEGAQFLYVKHLKNMFPRFDGVKVRLDCAYGCCAELAQEVFEALGAIVTAEHNVRNGNKVNVDCGAADTRNFVSRVKRDEIGFSFDGDGDRVLAVVNGKLYDGDAILLALSTLYRIQGKLRKKFVIGTVLTNSRLQRELAFQGTALVRADVGDKHILDLLIEKNCLLGGEKSGHVIMLDKANTGDGIITALSLLEVKKTIGNLPKFCPYPMLEFNLHTETPKEDIASKPFKAKIRRASELIENRGRLLVRPSGTEPYIRVAVEVFASHNEELFEKIKSLFEA